ncbi:MAG: VIT1/CCC1 transporter family protein, partial [Steroidobacteraceae bacterium]
MTAPGVDSWYHEKESAWLYRQVAAAEPDPHKRRLFEQLAVAAEEQAAKWELSARKASPAGGAPRTFTPSLRARIVARLLRRFDPRSMRAVLAAMKLRGLSVYSALSGSIAGHAMPTSLAEVGARHRSSLGGSLRAAVFGVNDGLVSNVSLVLGVAGAGAGNGYVLMAGAAGLLAGALSMAAGEYLSVRSQREMYEYQMALEREELAEYPQEEAEELALIYHARGVDLEQARSVSRALLAHPQQALEVLAREELGLNPDDLGSPWGAASASFVTFAVGAAVPLLPFVAHLAGTRAIVAAAIATAAALFAVGLGLSLFTGRDALRSALRMVLI